MRIVKVGKNKSAQFESIPGFVYCGRAFGGFDGSPLGNPFKVGLHGRLADVLAKYRNWLVLNLQKNNVVAVALRELTADSVLGCWCLDKVEAGTGDVQCHCDIIAQVWAQDQSGARNALPSQ